MWGNLLDHPAERIGKRPIIVYAEIGIMNFMPSSGLCRVSPRNAPKSQNLSVAAGGIIRSPFSLLESGVDCSVIALWLGHESIGTTQMYLYASLEMKERALAKIQPPTGHACRHRPPETRMSFLNSL